VDHVTDDRRRILVLWLGLVATQVANQVFAGLQARASKTEQYLVPPNKLIAGAVIFTGLGILAEWAPQLALALGVGVDLAALLGPAVAGAQQGNTWFDKLTALVKASAAP
jgi:hypothetical protein